MKRNLDKLMWVILIGVIRTIVNKQFLKSFDTIFIKKYKALHLQQLSHMHLIGQEWNISEYKNNLSIKYIRKLNNIL